MHHSWPDLFLLDVHVLELDWAHCLICAPVFERWKTPKWTSFGCHSDSCLLFDSLWMPYKLLVWAHRYLLLTGLLQQPRALVQVWFDYKFNLRRYVFYSRSTLVEDPGLVVKDIESINLFVAFK